MEATLEDLRVENRQLRGRLQDLTDEAGKNETISRRFQSIELSLLSAPSLPELLHRLFEGVADTLVLDDVSLVLNDRDHEVRHLLFHAGCQWSDFPGVLFTDDLNALTPMYAGLHRPWLGPCLGLEHASLFRPGSDLRSVAILPLISHGIVFGSLNLGSREQARYTRHHATDFHRHLAIVSAVCLENTINRERLVLSGHTDVLTGWHNRRYLQRRLPEELARAHRHLQPLSGLLLDVDHFKRVNDKYGHATGDRVLRDVADRVKRELRSSDVAVRYGGEEFAVLLPQTGLRDAARLAERIRQTVAGAPFRGQDGEELAVTLSIGVAQLRALPRGMDMESLGEQLLEDADFALYRAKAGGRNRVVRRQSETPGGALSPEQASSC